MEQKVIKVQFFKPIDGQVEYFFGSISAIFERFSAEQIGCTKESLWNAKITPDKPKATTRCLISKHPITRKPQSRK
jgi:hypothetical protein